MADLRSERGTSAFVQATSLSVATRGEYNEERPHEALDMATPASTHTESSRRFCVRMPDFEYAESIVKRKVRPNGCVKLFNSEIFISETLMGEIIAIEPVDDQHSAVYAGFLPVAVINLAVKKILDGKDAAPCLRALRAKGSPDVETDGSCVST